MNESELISVIVPVYNVEQYIGKCVESVFAQTYTNWELILVDDGSTDSSGRICDKYARQDDRVVAVHRQNGGASAARNYGLSMVQGKYVYFLDSDDWIVESTLKSLYDFIKLECANMVYYDAYAVNEQNGSISKKHYSHKKQYPSKCGCNMMRELLSNKEFHVAPWLLFYETAFLKEKMLSFKEGIIYEDMLFAYQSFVQAEKVAYLPQYLYYRRYRENSVMTSRISVHNYDSAVQIYESVRDFTNQLDKHLRIFEYVVKCSYNVINVYERLSFYDRRSLRKDIKRIKKDIRENHAYGDIALWIRCMNKYIWIIYKVIKKLQTLVLEKK